MLEYDTKAVVLSKKTIGESDAQVVLYTELLGKIELIARGLKKPTAKLSHHLESINLINASLVAVNHKHLTSALATKTFPNLRKNELALSIALRSLEILQEGIISPERDEFLWQELISFLDDLEEISTKKNDRLILSRSLYFLSRLVQALGLLPDSIDDLKNDLSLKGKAVLRQLVSIENFNDFNQDTLINGVYNEVEPFFKKLILQAHN